MDLEVFEAELKSQGYQVITTVSQVAGYAMDDHAHAFDACALITEGAFTIIVQGQARHYQKGEVIRLPAGTVHSEHAGPQGVTYRAGRRSKEIS